MKRKLVLICFICFICFLGLGFNTPAECHGMQCHARPHHMSSAYNHRCRHSSVGITFSNGVYRGYNFYNPIYMPYAIDMNHYGYYNYPVYTTPSLYLNVRL